MGNMCPYLRTARTHQQPSEVLRLGLISVTWQLGCWGAGQTWSSDPHELQLPSCCKRLEASFKGPLNGITKVDTTKRDDLKICQDLWPRSLRVVGPTRFPSQVSCTPKAYLGILSTWPKPAVGLYSLCLFQVAVIRNYHHTIWCQVLGRAIRSITLAPSSPHGQCQISAAKPPSETPCLGQSHPNRAALQARKARSLNLL